jgi:hypothetical protein
MIWSIVCIACRERKICIAATVSFVIFVSFAMSVWIVKNAITERFYKIVGGLPTLYSATIA